MKRFWGVSMLWTVSACGGSVSQQGTVQQLEPLRIEQQADGTTEAYDALGLYERALGHLHRGDCDKAVALYDQLADRFPESHYRSPGLYNAGFCLQERGQLEAAAARFERLLREGGRPEDERHGLFQLCKIRLDQEAFSGLQEVAGQLLAREDLDADERVEAMARNAQALLGVEELEAAEAAARDTLLFAKVRPEGDEVVDNTYLAAAAFVVGETMRLRSQAIAVPPGALEAQRAQLEQRAQWLLDAQHAYFDTIGHGHPQWSAAAGFRIGSMYRQFWDALMDAPPPEDPAALEDAEAYEAAYRERLRELARPLLRHAIRYWELTLMMMERARSRGPWVDRIRESLDNIRGELGLSHVSDASAEL